MDEYGGCEVEGRSEAWSFVDVIRVWGRGGWTPDWSSAASDVDKGGGSGEPFEFTDVTEACKGGVWATHLNSPTTPKCVRGGSGQPI